VTLTLSRLLQGVYFELGQLNYSVATGGTTATVVDSTMGGQGANDSWNNCALFITKDAGGLGAAPEGEFKLVTGFTDATGTFTLDSAFSAAVGAGDVYAYSQPRWPLYQAIQGVNHALGNLGDMVLVDQSTLKIESGKTEYVCGVDWKFAGPPLRIDIEQNRSDPNDQGWITVRDWEYEPATVDEAGKIIFKRQYNTDHYCRVWYRAPHPYVSAHADLISENIHPEVIKWGSVVELLKWMNERTQGEESGVVKGLNDARSEYENAIRRHPVFSFARKSKLFIW